MGTKRSAAFMIVYSIKPFQKDSAFIRHFSRAGCPNCIHACPQSARCSIIFRGGFNILAEAMAVRLPGLDHRPISRNILTIEYLQWFKGALARLLAADAKPGRRLVVTVWKRGRPAKNAADNEQALVCSENGPKTPIGAGATLLRGQEAPSYKVARGPELRKVKCGPVDRQGGHFKVLGRNNEKFY